MLGFTVGAAYTRNTHMISILHSQSDATNSTRERRYMQLLSPSCPTDRIANRAYIEQRVAKEEGMTLIFLESICNDPATIAANVALKSQYG